MSSDKQIAANGLNAQRSTGPRTPAGKARVSSNALKHGLTGQHVVLPGENPDDFDSFRTDLLISLDPQGALEDELAEKIVADLWRLRRVPIVEATIYRFGYKRLLVKQAAKSVRQYEKPLLMPIPEMREVASHDRQAHEDAQQRLARELAELDDVSFNATRVLKNSSHPLSNLLRHEVALSRSFLRTLHELERLQAKRAGQRVPVPAVVDVDVSVQEPAGERYRR